MSHKNRWKRMFCLFVAGMLLLLLPSCNQAESSPSAQNLIPFSEGDQNTPRADIVLYVGSNLYQFLYSKVQDFTKACPDITVDLQRAYVGGWNYENEMAYADALRFQLASGKGPDVIIYENQQFSDIYKTMQSNVFLDMNPLMEQDTEWNPNDYNAAVMDTGVVEGNRYMAPILFHARMLLTTREALALRGFPAEDWERLDVFAQRTKEYYEKFPEKYIFSETYGGLHFFIPYSGVPILDYSRNTPGVDTDDFRNLMEAYKAMYPTDMGKFQEGDFFKILGSIEDIHSIEDPLALLIIDSPRWIGSYIARLAQSGEPVCMPFPSATGEIVGIPQVMASIRASTENPEAAYTFVKFLLSYDQQLTSGDYSGWVPVNKAALENRIDDAYEFELTHLQLDENLEFTLEPKRPDGIFATAKEMAMNVTQGALPCDDLTAMVFDLMEPYFKDERSYESCLEDLRDKLTIYLNE